MIDIYTAFILGVIQGATEFLPVSSTGHLILARELFNLDTAYGLAFDALLHLATAAAVIVYFRRDIVRLTFSFFDWVSGRDVTGHDRVLILSLILGTIPAVFFGLLLEDQLETIFRSAGVVVFGLVFGSLLMLAAEWYVKKRERSYLTPPKGLLVGLFQALALIPGMSRSGSVIVGGLFLGLSREEAARFGFLLAIPIILGAGAKKFLDLGSASALGELALPLMVGTVSAFGVGMLAIHYLLKFVRSHTLMVFVVYRFILAGVVLLLI